MVLSELLHWQERKKASKTRKELQTRVVSRHSNWLSLWAVATSSLALPFKHRKGLRIKRDKLESDVPISQTHTF